MFLVSANRKGGFHFMKGTFTKNSTLSEMLRRHSLKFVKTRNLRVTRITPLFKPFAILFRPNENSF